MKRARALALARADAERRLARAQFLASAGRVRERLAPGALAQDAMQLATDRAQAMLRQGVEHVKARPGTVAALLAGLGAGAAWLLARPKRGTRKHKRRRRD
ncbi:MAG: hypothetical protein ACOY45_00370 [Pseudomonadota bacterium]